MLVLEQDFAKDSCTAEPEAYTLEGKTERKIREGGWGRGRGGGRGVSWISLFYSGFTLVNKIEA